MSDYTKTTNFTAKDALSTGDPNKVVKGSLFDTEYDALATSSATKSNKVVSGVTDNVITQTAGGDLADSGYSFSGLVGDTAVTKAEIDILDGATVTTAEVNILDGVTADATELNYNDVTTLGTAEASKTVTTDASSDVIGLNSVTSTTFVGALTGNASTATTATNARTVLLESQTASSSSSIDLTTGIDSTYDQYEIRITGCIPATDGGTLYGRLSDDSGSTFETSANYAYASTTQLTTSGTVSTNANGGDTAFVISAGIAVGGAATEGIDLKITIINPSSSTNYTTLLWEGTAPNTAGEYSIIRGGGVFKTTPANDAIQFLFASGNISSGTFALYGITP